jgi:CSLREA domain-containing protein
MSTVRLSLAVAVAVAAAAVGFVGPAHAAPGSSYVVDSTTDAVDAVPGDGACRTSAGRCSLRAAVMEANATGGGTITLPAGRFGLTLAPSLLDRILQVVPLVGDDRGGDLDVKTAITFQGAGAERTIVDANQVHRVLHVLPLASATLTDLTITGGRNRSAFADGNGGYAGGGGVWNAATLRLTRVVVRDNEASYGGGVFNDPASTASFSDVVVRDNRSGEAGGVRCDAACTFLRTTVTGNVVTDPHDPTRPGALAGTGGGVDIRGVLPVSFIDSTIAGNEAPYGAGINAAPGYVDTFPDPTVPVGTQVLLRNTVLRDNDGANCRAQWAAFVDQGGNVDSDGTCLG